MLNGAVHPEAPPVGDIRQNESLGWRAPWVLATFDHIESMTRLRRGYIRYSARPNARERDKSNAFT